MKFWYTHGPGSDGTAAYDVTEYKAITAKEFAHEVITTEPNEWGRIEVDGFGSVKYRDGELLTEIPASWEYLTVVSVKSAGGWSSMDYFLKVNPRIDYYKLYQK